MCARVNGLHIESLNVPYALRGVFEGAVQADTADQRNGAPFEVTIAFGRRFEPRITGASRK